MGDRMMAPVTAAERPEAFEAFEAFEALPERPRYTILRFDSAGRPELYSETCLASEIEHFEDLGYLVEPHTTG